MDFHLRIKIDFKNANITVIFYRKRQFFSTKITNRQFNIRNFRISKNIWWAIVSIPLQMGKGHKFQHNLWNDLLQLETQIHTSLHEKANELQNSLSRYLKLCTLLCARVFMTLTHCHCFEHYCSLIMITVILQCREAVQG